MLALKRNRTVRKALNRLCRLSSYGNVWTDIDRMGDILSRYKVYGDAIALLNSTMRRIEIEHIFYGSTEYTKRQIRDLQERTEIYKVLVKEKCL